MLAALGGLTAVLVVAQATALATVLATAIHGRLDTAALAGFVAAVGGARPWSWGQGTVAARAAATVKATLRADLLSAVGRRGPAGSPASGPASWPP